MCIRDREGGAAAVIKEEDSYDKHFHDTVAGGDWLCEQDVVEYFVEHSPDVYKRQPLIASVDLLLI